LWGYYLNSEEEIITEPARSSVLLLSPLSHPRCSSLMQTRKFLDCELLTGWIRFACVSLCAMLWYIHSPEFYGPKFTNAWVKWPTKCSEAKEQDIFSPFPFLHTEKKNQRNFTLRICKQRGYRTHGQVWLSTDTFSPTQSLSAIPSAGYMFYFCSLSTISFI
jgi:hypothetical protein